jgi:PAT family acetyl-CoA transporter-like MFS transporter 1
MQSATAVHLTLAFFVLVVMVATQDIAVDGWAITMLSQDNQSYASTCQVCLCVCVCVCVRVCV